MKKLMNKINSKLISAQIKAEANVQHFLSSERGDTNFISIAIIMVIVIAVAVVFIAFKDKLMAAFNDAVDKLFSKL